MNQAVQTTPDALLFIAPGCPHCATVLKGLAELIKKAEIGTLEVVNIAVHPQRAEELGIRSVPWLRLGPFELQGLRSESELRDWAQKAGSTQGLANWYEELFKQGKLSQAIEEVRENPDHIEALLSLASDEDTELTVRIGISAVFEEFEGSSYLQDYIEDFKELGQHQDPRIRSDAGHYLALTHAAEAINPLEQLSRDKERAVREIAEDSLQDLRDNLRH